jgi:hypothetical protein
MNRFKTLNPVLNLCANTVTFSTNLRTVYLSNSVILGACSERNVSLLQRICYSLK